jgi:hypothetical protein
MLEQVCDPTRVAVTLLPPRLLPFDVIARVAETQPALLCLGAVVPGGVPHLRYLCKQLRARFPSLPLVVGCWGASEPVAETVALLRADGLDHIGTTLQSTRDHLMTFRTCQGAPPGECSRLERTREGGNRTLILHKYPYDR